MFKTRGKKALEYIAEIIENYCRMRLEGDKVVAGILKDIEFRLGGIDQTLIETAVQNSINIEKMTKGKTMLKGVVKPDGTVTMLDEIVKGSDRTSAICCFEMGILRGINQHGVCVRMVHGTEVPEDLTIAPVIHLTAEEMANALCSEITAGSITFNPLKANCPNCLAIHYQEKQATAPAMSTDINEIPDEPDQPAEPEQKEANARASSAINQVLPESQNSAEKHPGGGVQPQN